MVCMWVDFHENDGNHDNNENDETTQTATNKELSDAFAEITEMTKTAGIRGANHGFPKNLFGLVLTSKGYFKFSGYLE